MSHSRAASGIRRRRNLCAAWTIALAAWPAVTTAQPRLQLVSRAINGIGGCANASGYGGCDQTRSPVSADGRFVAYGRYVHDRKANTTTSIDVGYDGAPANNHIRTVAISADGRYVAMGSGATNLVAGDSNGVYDAFVRDLLTGTTARVSVASDGTQANAGSGPDALSGDGRYVLFGSSATNLVSSATNNRVDLGPDLFLHDRVARSTERIAVDSWRGALSADGRFVAFVSYLDHPLLVDTDLRSDVFVLDRATGLTTRVSVGPGGVPANGDSDGPALSADGRFVTFLSDASNLVPGDVPGTTDVFVHDRLLGSTMQVNLGSPGQPSASPVCSSPFVNGTCFAPSISGDGRFVTWALGNLFVMIRDRESGTTIHVAGGGARGVQCSYEASGEATMSADGSSVTFWSQVDLTRGDDDYDGCKEDVFVYDLRPRAWARDFDGDQRSDATLFRPSSGTWYQSSSATGVAAGRVWGATGDVPVAADYDGDGLTDIAVFRPGTGSWYIVESRRGSARGVVWGAVGDVPVPADYDGDGKADVAVFRPPAGTWYIVRSSTATPVGIPWGQLGDIPVPADYDGDGRTDVAVFRPPAGAWYIVESSTGSALGIPWGQNGDVPVPADYSGWGRADLAVFRNGTWYRFTRPSCPVGCTGIATSFLWGAAGDVPVTGDFDGDGAADPTVFRPASGTWYQLWSGTSYWDRDRSLPDGRSCNIPWPECIVPPSGFALVWGAPGDLPQ